MSEQDPPSREQNRRPPSGPVSSPRAYFGRASRNATGALRAGISEMPEPPSPLASRRPPIYRAGDPALRLFAGFSLSLPATTPLTGAIVTLSGIRDGEHERLFVDLGTSLVRSTPRRDEQAGKLSLILSRTQSAETYATLLGSLRYVNDAAAPTHGVRAIALQIIDGGGHAQDVASVQFGVGEAPPEPVTEIVAADERIVFGENLHFNTDGDYTLFWWPRLLPDAAQRARRVARPADLTTEAGPEAAASSFFSAGGKVYRLFDSVERPSAPAPIVTPARAAAPIATPTASAATAAPAPPAPANPIRVAPPMGAPLAANDQAAPAKPAAANDPVWVPGRGAPPPGFERPRMLRLEDIFGSDMQDAMARRLIDMRLAAGAA